MNFNPAQVPDKIISAYIRHAELQRSAHLADILSKRERALEDQSAFMAREEKRSRKPSEAIMKRCIEDQKRHANLAAAHDEVRRGLLHLVIQQQREIERLVSAWVSSKIEL